MTLVPGVKWNLTDTWVLAANVSIPLTTGGLTAPLHAVRRAGLRAGTVTREEDRRPSVIRSRSVRAGVDLPVAAGLAQREVPDARFGARLAAADLGDVARRAMAGRGRRLAAQAHVARVEGQRLRLETVEGARERRLVDRRPYGLRRLRIEAFVRRAIALQRLFDQPSSSGGSSRSAESSRPA